MKCLTRLLGLAAAAGLASGALASLPGSPFAQQKNEVIPGEILVKHPVWKAAQVMAASRQKFRPADIQLPGARAVSRIAGTGWVLYSIPKSQDPRAYVASMFRSGTVITAEPVNRVYPLLDEPNDPDWNYVETSDQLIFNADDEVDVSFLRLWHLMDVGAPDGWIVWPNTWYTAKTKPRNAPLMAIIDTGCDMGHPDFANAGSSSTDAPSGGQLVWSLSRQFSLGDVVPNGSPMDSHGHGTHVAGLAVAAGNNGSFDGDGVIGTGYGARAMILRVFDDSGNGSDADAAAAIYYAADNGAAVINLSLGTTNYSQLFQDAVTYAFQKGSLVICAGNESGAGGGDIGPIYPAACSGALAVSANGPDLAPATTNYSGTGSYVSVAAPGGDVIIGEDFTWFAIQYDFSTAPRYDVTMNQIGYMPAFGNNYAYLVGTSMACPVVSGAAAHWFGAGRLTQSSPYANLKGFQAIQRSAYSYMGAPNGSWEPTQGYGCLDMGSLMQSLNARGATVGSIQGSVYYNATALGNVAVRATRTGSTVNYQTTTGADGTYRFDQLPPGTYTVKAAPFGSLKTKYTVVRPGCDMPGFNFWGGTFTWDETPPVVQASVKLRKLTSVAISHHMYDTETGIDDVVFQIGRTAGSSEILAPTRIVLDGSDSFTITGLNMVNRTRYVGRLTVTNGGGQVTTFDLDLSVQ